MGFWGTSTGDGDIYLKQILGYFDSGHGAAVLGGKGLPWHILVVIRNGKV